MPHARPGRLRRLRALSLVLAAGMAAASAAAAPDLGTDPTRTALDPGRLCAQLAAWEPDPARDAPAVAAERFDADAARRACTRALAAAPHDPALRFALARAHHRLGDADTAYALLELSADAGHAGALLALGRMFETGDHVRRDLTVALLHYLEAGRKGAPAGFRAAGAIYAEPAGAARDDGLAESMRTLAGDPSVPALAPW